MKELANAGPTEEEMFEIFLNIASKTTCFDLIGACLPMSSPDPIIESKDSDEDKK